MKEYNIVEDHAELKKIIKDAELRIDEVVKQLLVDGKLDIASQLDQLSNELMSINM